MTVKLIVKIDLSTTEDRELIERALCERVREILIDNPELREPGDDDNFGRVIGIIDDVEVTAR